MKFVYALTVATLVFAPGSVDGADWPAFRGPQGTGLSIDPSAPTHWGPDHNIAWKAPLPRPANGSPIVSNGKVFVTSAEDEAGRQRSLYCFGRHSGTKLWVKTVHFGKRMPTHKTNPYGGSTPVSDGQRVVVWHGSAGLYCYDMNGKELWSQDLGEFRHMWGYGTSPIIHQGTVILHTGPGKREFISAFDLETGQQIWETEESAEGGNGEKRADGKYRGSWSTPVLAHVSGRDQLILMMSSRVNGYDPNSGELIWTVDGLRHDQGDLAYSSPVIAGDICFVTGGFQGPAMAFRIGGDGNVTKTNRLWRNEKNPQNIGSGVCIDGYVYRPNAGPGTIDCLDPRTGEILWEDRGAGGDYWASIVGAGGLLYATNQKGTTLVFKPNPRAYEQVAENKLGESTNATPAISDGQIFVRTAGHLFCIQDKS
ncbi:MAG: PQQ-like beta-propeller repeat protein [Planctomycetes bacterium]|nr:PQQ-like beta-propeller repeat protein [Planctomycetota bacterium]